MYMCSFTCVVQYTCKKKTAADRVYKRSIMERAPGWPMGGGGRGWVGMWCNGGGRGAFRASWGGFFAALARSGAWGGREVRGHAAAVGCGVGRVPTGSESDGAGFGPGLSCLLSCAAAPVSSCAVGDSVVATMWLHACPAFAWQRRVRVASTGLTKR